MSKGTSVNFILLLKGLVAVIIGFYFVSNPASAIKDVGFAFGLVLSILGVLWAIRVWKRNASSDQINEGYLGPLTTIITGLMLIFFLDKILTLMFILMGAWILVMGLFHIRTSPGFNRRRMVMSRGILFLGIFLVLIGILVLLNPDVMVDILVTILGISMMLAGGLFVVLSIQVNE